MLALVILFGGSGTRLWFLSRELYPKHFLPLINEATLLQETQLWLNGFEGLAKPLVMCNESQRFIVIEQLCQAGSSAVAIFFEPFGCNTAQAMAVVTLQMQGAGGDTLLLVLLVDVVPVAVRDRVQDVKGVVEQMRKHGRG